MSTQSALEKLVEADKIHTQVAETRGVIYPGYLAVIGNLVEEAIADLRHATKAIQDAYNEIDEINAETWSEEEILGNQRSALEAIENALGDG